MAEGNFWDPPKLSLKDWSSKKLLRDYQHASRLITDGNFRLAPKQKFLFFVVFNFSDTAAKLVHQDIKDHASMLVKSTDLPSFTFDTQLMNQYNRWRSIQTKLNYEPIQIRIHDDMADVSKRLWYSYLDYYYEDQKNGELERYTAAPDTYTGLRELDWGMTRPRAQPFFKSIQLYSIYGAKKFSEYTLVNPMITNFNHDNHDHSASDILENTFQVQYETVKYASGWMDGGQPGELINGPRGFGDLHYDKEFSPNDPLNNKKWEDMVDNYVDSYKQDLSDKRMNRVIEAKNLTPKKSHIEGWKEDVVVIKASDIAKAKNRTNAWSFPLPGNVRDAYYTGKKDFNSVMEDQGKIIDGKRTVILEDGTKITEVGEITQSMKKVNGTWV